MTMRRDMPPTLSSRRDGMRPKSPAEALEPGRAPPRPKGVKQPRPQNKKVSGLVRFLSGIMTLSLVGLAALTGGGLLLNHVTDRAGPLDVSRTVAIPKGTSRNDMADRLQKEGVIASSWTFVTASYVSEWFGEHKGESLKYGDYEFKQGASVREVLDTIFKGSSVQAKLTIPEGLTSHQIVERIKADPNLTGDIAEVPAEGALYPDTYRFSKGMVRQELVNQMVAKQQEVLAAEWEKRQEGLPTATPEQALVLASIVEKETGKADERERVAAVFVNRLKKNMRLESDPTVLYGLFGGAVQWGKPILQSELEAKNTHNTYEIKGLPPTPICNPGRAAIAAVLNPAKSEEIYFVADGKGGHVFSTTLKEHNAAVAKWRKAEKEIRAGEKEAKAKEEAEAKAAAAAPAPAPPAVVTPPAKTELPQPAGQRAVVKTVPPPAGPATIPSPPAEQPAKPAAASAAAVVKTVPTPGATAAAGAAGSPVKTVPAPGTATPVKTVQPAAAPQAPAVSVAPETDVAPVEAVAPGSLPLPVRKPKKTN